MYVGVAACPARGTLGAGAATARTRGAPLPRSRCCRLAFVGRGEGEGTAVPLREPVCPRRAERSWRDGRGEGARESACARACARRRRRGFLPAAGRRASSTRPPACTQRRSARGARRWRRARKRDVEVAPACVRCVRSPPPPARRPRRAIRTEQGPLPRPSACRYPRTSGSRSRPRSASCARAASQPRPPTRALVTDANTRRARRVGTSSRA